MRDTLGLLALLLASACSGSSVSIEVDRWVSHASEDGTLFEFEEHAEEVRDLELRIAPGETFVVADTSADLRVRVAEHVEPSVLATVTAFAHSRERAEEVLGTLQLRVERSGSVNRLHVDQPAGTDAWSWDGRRDHAFGLSLVVLLPPATLLDAQLRFGNVVSEGPLSQCHVSVERGSIDVGGVQGLVVDLSSGSGSVALRDVDGRQVHLKSDFGAVRCADVHAQSVDARTQSGAVTVERVESSVVSAHSSFGAVTLANVTGIVDARTESGHVTLTDGETSSALLSSEFGGITVTRSTGALDLRTQSGRVEVTGHRGALDAFTSFGAIAVDGTFPRLVLSSLSGSVTARVRDVGAPASEWKLTSGFGSVALTVPADFGAILDAETDFGGIEVVPALADRLERKGSGARIRAQLGRSSENVILRTASGSIRVGTAD